MKENEWMKLKLAQTHLSSQLWMVGMKPHLRYLFLAKNSSFHLKPAPQDSPKSLGFVLSNSKPAPNSKARGRHSGMALVKFRQRFNLANMPKSSPTLFTASCPLHSPPPSAQPPATPTLLHWHGPRAWHGLGQARHDNRSQSCPVCHSS